MDFQPEIVKGGITLMVALVGAYVGARLALQKHRKEKRWEARYAACQDIMMAISAIHTWAEEAYASAKLLPALNSEKMAELSEQFHRARHLLWRYARVGGLVLSKTSVESLDVLLSDLESERFRFEEEGVDDSNYDDVLSEHCEKLRSMLDKHIPLIMQAAEADLR
jgi:hypothetical protein